MRMLSALIALLLIAGAGWGQAQDTTQEAITAYKNAAKAYGDAALELQRIDLRKQKRELIRAFLELNETQSAAFWPVYDKYEKELITINDHRLDLIKDYAANYGTLTDAKAVELAASALDFQQKRLALRKSLMDSAKNVLPGILVARLMQLDHQMDLEIDLQIASEVPLAK